MKKHVAIAFIGAVATLGGCASLEQAPLVYSSTNQMGVVVSGGKAESPAPSLIIGYNGVDVAFVPVAVAKHCPKEGTTQCGNIDYRVQTISGSNRQTGQMLLDAQTAKQFQDAIEADNKIIAANAGLIAEHQRQIDERRSLAGLNEQFARLTPAPPLDGAVAEPQTPEEIQRAANLKAEIDRISAINEQSLLEKIGQMKATNAATAATIASNREALRLLVARKDETTGDDKVDALSVYGSFDGNATGKKDGASLSLGKVFSTGIAAQNLTQGIGRSARLSAAAQCITAAHVLISQANPKPSPAAVDLLLASCGQPVEKE